MKLLGQNLLKRNHILIIKFKAIWLSKIYKQYLLLRQLLSVKKNINSFLDPIRQKRSEILRNKSEILDIIIEGSKRAREVTKKNLELIKEAMSLNFKQGVFL